MKKVSTTAVVYLFLAAISGGQLQAQTLDFLSVRIHPEVNFPAFGDEAFFATGGGSSVSLDFDVLPFVSPSFEAGFSIFPTLAEESFSAATAGAGLRAAIYPSTRFGFSASGIGGIYQVSYGSEAFANLFAKARGELAFRFSPAFALSAAVSYTHLFGNSEPLYRGIGAGLSAGFSLSGFRGGTNVSISGVSFDAIFPIFYSHYDKNALGSLTLRNEEAGAIRDVRVSLYIRQYMDQPKLCASFPVIGRGRSVEVPVYALLTDQVLKLTESSKISAEVIIDYTFIDSPRQARISETLRVNHRNAMIWDDDRKAAAFVSAKDPAVLRYSKYAAGLIRETGQNELDQNLRFAIGLFEGLKLYGLNYVVDPTTPYKELSQNKSSLDFLQFPNQTLTYKGGDCDDLSILFCSILESVGIKTAFITIPGHIYMAFALDLPEEEAKGLFADSSDLIFQGGKTWFPIEVTALNDGFLKAWQLGSKQWRDNARNGAARLILIEEAWKEFEPVGIPGEDTRIVLPPPDQVVAAYSAALNRFVAREIQPKADALRSEIQLSGNQARLINRLGVLYARYGLVDQAKAEFERAARQAYAPALTNLGNIAYLQKRYPEAISFFQRAISQNGDQKTALIGLARAQYELENYAEADRAYAQVRSADPALAGKYPYLISRTDGAARASSAADREGRAAWNEE